MASSSYDKSACRDGFVLARVVPILVFLVWLGIGIRQWFVLSKWTKKYERYKQLQRKVDEKLEYDTDEGIEGEHQQLL